VRCAPATPRSRPCRARRSHGSQPKARTSPAHRRVHDLLGGAVGPAGGCSRRPRSGSARRSGRRQRRPPRSGPPGSPRRRDPNTWDVPSSPASAAPGRCRRTSRGPARASRWRPRTGCAGHVRVALGCSPIWRRPIRSSGEVAALGQRRRTGSGPRALAEHEAVALGPVQVGRVVAEHPEVEGGDHVRRDRERRDGRTWRREHAHACRRSTVA